MITYNAVMAQANNISSLSGELSREIFQLEDVLTMVRRDWKGPASEAFQKQLVMLIADMKAIQSNMSSVSNNIRSEIAKI